MIAIRLWLEVPSPTGEGVKRLPVLPGELVVPGFNEILTATVEEVNVYGQSYEMKRIGDPASGGSIRLRLLGAPDNLTDGAFKTLVMDIVEEAG